MNKLKNLIFWKKKDKILVLSGWWFRWLYTVWILKWLEELWIKKDIKAIFGVSIWAVVWSLRANGISADEIYKLITSTSISRFYGTDIFKKSGWILSNKKIKQIAEEYLPKSFGKLKIKLFVWSVDTNTAKYILFEKWDLQKTVLWSMSIPGIFPPIEYKTHNLLDGGMLNNFPVDLAKTKYPKSTIIWVALNKFEKNQKIETVVDSLMVSFEIMMRSKLLENTKYVDHLFYKKIPISILSLDKKKMKKAFDMWYEDCLKEFWK
jgi:NTE family protein